MKIDFNQEEREVLLVLSLIFFLIMGGWLLGKREKNEEIIVPEKIKSPEDGKKKEFSSNTTSERKSLPSSVSRKIDLNQASRSELEALPLIGPERAQRIIAYRKQKGGFKKIEEIKNVEGIGKGIFERIKNLISCGGKSD
jgi:competence protein ComEA